jgi:hypothetical protein
VAVGVVGVLEDAHVDADALLGNSRFLLRLAVELDAKGSEPLTCRFLLECDLLECGVVGYLSVELYRYVREFRKGQESLTALLVKIETRLTVRETAELAQCFSLDLADAVAVLFEFSERRNVLQAEQAECLGA